MIAFLRTFSFLSTFRDMMGSSGIHTFQGTTGNIRPYFENAPKRGHISIRPERFNQSGTLFQNRPIATLDEIENINHSGRRYYRLQRQTPKRSYSIS
jgi:hypothetical protein